MDAAREFGGKLFDAIFSRDMIACLRSSLDEAARREAMGLRFRLHLQEAPELARLPWEFLFDTQLERFFATSETTPIVRYLEMPERITPLAVDLPLRILAMISNPEDPKYTRLDFEGEKAKLQESLYQLTSQGKVEVDWLEKPTLAALLRQLRTHEYHVFHFIGHGGFDEKSGEGLLVLEDEQRRAWPAEAGRIGTILHDHRLLRLAVLNSCEGARTSITDPFGGTAATLIRQGIPAVVAMQFEITDKAAITFSAEFYNALADGLPVDAAVSAARKAILSMPNDLEWGTPVLHMRSPDGILFSIEKRPIVQKPVERIAEPAKSRETQPIESKATIRSLRAELGAVHESRRGMLIHVGFDVNGFRAVSCQVAAYFWGAGLEPLKDVDQKYNSVDGQVSVGSIFSPGSDVTSYDDFQVFMPYSQLHLPAGEHEIKFDVKLFGGAESKELARSEFVTFLLNLKPVEIYGIWVEHNVQQEDQKRISKGMLIHVEFAIEGHKNEKCYLIAFFNQMDNTKLKDIDGQYCAPDGQVAVSRDFVPDLDSETFWDSNLFMPYDQIHADGDLKFHVAIHDAKLQLLVISDWVNFRIERPPVS
jgi:hypothetical protein